MKTIWFISGKNILKSPPNPETNFHQPAFEEALEKIMAEYELKELRVMKTDDDTPPEALQKIGGSVFRVQA